MSFHSILEENTSWGFNFQDFRPMKKIKTRSEENLPASRIERSQTHPKDLQIIINRTHCQTKSSAFFNYKRCPYKIDVCTLLQGAMQCTGTINLKTKDGKIKVNFIKMLLFSSKIENKFKYNAINNSIMFKYYTSLDNLKYFVPTK